MESKAEYAAKNLNVENAEEGNEGRENAPVQYVDESLHLGGSEGQNSGGSVRWRRVRRLAPIIRWAIPNRHVAHHEFGDDVERLVEQMMEIKKKSRQLQVNNLRFQTPEPDNHYDFCLIP
ncbi:protein BEX4 [Ochotona princeps]|uniref:protein BEX4 n=1 Tax=Ochotona princeps TaxID=9978 RepID=UPI00017753F8|nr:protein BEX4 [Ochotona princeps]